MQTKSGSQAVAPVLQDVSTNMRWVGWISFWVQLGLIVVSLLVLLFAASGRNFSTATNAGIGIGIFWAVCGLLALGCTTFLAFRYTRVAKRLLNKSSDLRPTKADTIQLLKIGLVMGLVGILLNLFGAGATVGVLVAKSVSQPPGVAITDPNRIIRALDVFVEVANINGIAAHFVGTVSSLWLLHRVHQH